MQYGAADGFAMEGDRADGSGTTLRQRGVRENGLTNSTSTERGA